MIRSREFVQRSDDRYTVAESICADVNSVSRSYCSVVDESFCVVLMERREKEREVILSGVVRVTYCASECDGR